jgi:hypothetical protein
MAENQLRCMVCTNPVDSTRVLRNRSSVCSDACHKEYRRRLNAMSAGIDCPSCHRPVNASERAAFRRFNMAEKVLGDKLYPRLFKLFREKGGKTREQFLALLDEGETISSSVQMDAHLVKTSWEKTREKVDAAATGGRVSARDPHEVPGPVQTAVQAGGVVQDEGDGAGRV